MARQNSGYESGGGYALNRLNQGGMRAPLLIKETYRPYFVLLALVLAAMLQGLHFYFYYEQTASNSIVWSVVDWSAWFFVVGVFHLLFGQFPSHTIEKIYWLVFIGVVLFSGIFQIILSNTINGLIWPPSRSFLEDILHLYDKRWLQNLFYAGFLWQFFNLLWPLRSKPIPTLNQPQKQKTKAIRFSDGKSVYWVNPGQIHYVKSARNYLNIYFEGRRIMVRESLSDFESKVPKTDFVRINRSCLINKAEIIRIEPYSRYSKQIVLKDNSKFKIGKTYLTKVEDFLRDN